MLHVSAGNPFRRWPRDAFVELVCRAGVDRSEAPGHLTAGTIRRRCGVGCCERRAGATRPHERAAIVECGEFDLVQLRALLGRASLYIGGDSGPLHIVARRVCRW